MSAERSSLFPEECWCGNPVQLIDDHPCRQCGPHCELERYRRGLSVLDRRPVSLPA